MGYNKMYFQYYFKARGYKAFASGFANSKLDSRAGADMLNRGYGGGRNGAHLFSLMGKTKWGTF